MKKLLIATAAFAMVAGTAQAQSVTLYGSIDTGYSSVESKTATTKTTNAGIGQSSDVSSRWGIRGSEDLGGGMKANFNVETSIGSGSNGALNSNTDAAGARLTLQTLVTVQCGLVFQQLVVWKFAVVYRTNSSVMQH